MKIPKFFILAAAIFLSLHAQAATQRWVIHEQQPDLRIRVRVIEGDASAAQDAIAQDVVFDQTMASAEFAKFDVAHAPLRAFVAPQGGQPLWEPAQNGWTPTDEDTYSAWFAANANPKFLDGSNLKVDCADSALLYRWVYARNNRLPVANTLSGSGRLVGHFTSNAAWDQLATDPDWKKDERFKAALRYVFQNTYTTSVSGDMAPTLINPQYVRPGSLFMIIRRGSGHAQSVQDVDLHAGITTLWGNEPASGTIYQSPILIEFGQSLTFGVWREPRLKSASSWELTPATEMPGYSLEQFQQKFTDENSYTSWVFDRLGIQLTNLQKLTSLSMNLLVGVGQRLMVTAQGVFACYYKTCTPSSQDYEDYSTFSRDARLLNMQNEIIALVNSLDPDDADVQQWKASLVQTYMPIPGSNLTPLELALDPTLMKAWNSDPRVSFAKRWGFHEPVSYDPNFDFFMSSEVMYELMLSRDSYVQYKQDSSVLDSQIRKMFAFAKKDMADEKFLSSSFTAVHDNFETAHVDVDDKSVCTGGICSINDLTWEADGGGDRVSHWTSAAGDSALSRWGFAAPAAASAPARHR